MPHQPDEIQSNRVICEGGLDSSDNHILLSLNKPGAATRLINFESSIIQKNKKFLISEHYYIPLVERLKIVSEIEKKYLTLSYLYSSIIEESERLREGKLALENAKKIYLSKLKQLPQCPLCGTKITLTENKLNEFIDKW